MTISKPNPDQENQPCTTAECECSTTKQHPPPQYSSEPPPPPTTSTDSNTPENTITRDATPYPGETFIIIHKASNKAITLCRDGSLRLGDEPYDLTKSPTQQQQQGQDGSSSQWFCMERNGWLGFRSLSGKYIGQGSPDRRIMVANAGQHQAWENLCVRRHPRGGYLIMTPIEESWLFHWFVKLMKVEVVDSNQMRNLVLREDGGALWEFVKVDAHA